MDFRNLRENPIEEPALPDEATVDLGDLQDRIDPKKTVLTVDLPDGSVNINFGPLLPESDTDSKEHEANLAFSINDSVLSGIADELLRLIEEDLRRQDLRLRDIEKGIDLLGVKLEEPRTEPSEEGMSVVKHPLLLEAILRFQANARGEMLPVDGPVKIRNDGAQTRITDTMANALQQDFNHYLTVGAPEFYPDTDRMFFTLGHGGEAYKKVYDHPLKRRPVSETVDRKDLILSQGAVSVEANPRVTHRSHMKPSDVKRMQLVGAWRDCLLGDMALSDDNPIDRKLQETAGFNSLLSVDPAQNMREIYECYCELNIEGFEHTEDGEATGLALPYRVTIDKVSRQVLDVRRWWAEDDDTYTRQEVFIEYVFVPAFDGLNLGLLHILGNATRALTAAWRIALDNGMLANFPGGLMARGVGRQQTTNIRIAPGTAAPIDTEGAPIRDAFAPLPYRDVTPGFVSIVQSVEQTAQRVGGTAETAVGEGRQDAPVGTTIAMIEQATKVLNAVHKRMHTAQSKEFRLLKDLLCRNPEALWRGNKEPQLPKNAQLVEKALHDANIVPVADPNTASQTLRIQKAIAIKTMAASNPQLYDMAAVDRRILEMVGVEDIDELMAKGPPPAMGPDPAKLIDGQAKMLSAQAKLADVQIKSRTAAEDSQLRQMEAETKKQDVQRAVMDSVADNANRAKDREAKIELERLKLERQGMIHQDRMGLDHLREGNRAALEERKFAQGGEVDEPERD